MVEEFPPEPEPLTLKPVVRELPVPLILPGEVTTLVREERRNKGGLLRANDPVESLSHVDRRSDLHNVGRALVGEVIDDRLMLAGEEA